MGSHRRPLLEEKRLFLLFLTGVEVPPEPGVERLQIELPFSAFSQEEHRAMLNMLPQAHTCTNTLELPNYHDALLESGVVKEEQGPEVLAAELRRVIGEKIRVAINESNGYELDAISVQDVEQVSDAPTAATAVPSVNAVEEARVSELPPIVTAAAPPVSGLLVRSATPGRRGSSPGAYPSTSHSPGPRLDRTPSPFPMEARPALKLPAIVPRKVLDLELEEQAPVAAVQTPELVSKTKAPSPPMQTDVDTLLHDCGLLSLLAEERQQPSRSPSEKKQLQKAANVGGSAFDLGEAVVVEDFDR
uniref:HECT domain-containing protein n=1 Tax=Alexandrium catenella TaxID=2925 RepID=A0A7S1QLD2_ALECA